MTHFSFSVTCGHCSQPLDVVNGAGGPSERVAVVACTACGREWLIVVQMRPLLSREGKRRRELRRRAVAA